MRYGSEFIVTADPVGLAKAIPIVAGGVWSLVAHYSLIGEIKRRGVEVPWFLYGWALFIEIEYLKSGDFRTKKLDFLAYSAMLAFVVGAAISFAIGSIFG
jgi:hypothetical protein